MAVSDCTSLAQIGSDWRMISLLTVYAAISYLQTPRLGWRWLSIYANEGMQCGDCFYNQLPWRANSLLLWDTFHLILHLCLSFLLSVCNYVYMNVFLSGFLCAIFFFLTLSLTDGAIDSKTLKGLTCADPALFVYKFYSYPLYRTQQNITEDSRENGTEQCNNWLL